MKQPSPFDFDHLVVEVLKHMRGKESQSRLSQRLGYSFNQCGKWESGEKRLLWKEFVRICAQKKINLKDALLVGQIAKPRPEHPEKMLQEMQGDMTVAEFSRLLGRHRLSVSRQLEGKSEISLADFLQALFATRNHLLGFLHAIVSTEAYETILTTTAQLDEARIYSHYPWVAALLRVYELKEFEKKPPTVEVLATRFGFPRAHLEEVIPALLKAGVLFPTSKGGYDTAPAQMQTTVGKYRRVSKEYWVRLAHEAVRVLPEDQITGYADNVFGSMVFNIPDESWQDFLAFYNQMYRKLAELANSVDQSKLTRVKVVAFQFLDLEMVAEAKAKART